MKRKSPLIGSKRFQRSYKRPNYSGLAFVFFFSLITPFIFNKLRAPPKVCILLSTDDEEKGVTVSGIWEDKFPVFAYIFDSSAHGNFTSGDPDSLFFARLKGNVHVYRANPRLSYHTALDGLLRAARKKSMGCDYYFVHDDDLVVRTNGKGSAFYLLSSVISKYRPAILALPWQTGWSIYPESKKIFDSFAGDVAPLTAFDEGQTMFHKDIVDFFIPAPPAGEGGFVGHFTLNTHFWNFFANLIFRHHALVAKDILFENLHSLDAGTHSFQTKDDEGFIWHSGVRHPYEYDQNAAYIDFLNSGLLDSDTRTGGNVLASDVRNYDLKSGLRGYSQRYVIDKLATTYDLTHPALSSCHFMQEDSVRNLVAKKSPVRPVLHIYIFGKNRPITFERAVNSVVQATEEYMKRQGNILVKITIVIDMEWVNREAYQDVKKRAFTWQRTHSHINIDIILNSSERGLRQIMFDIYEAGIDREYALFVEDDIEISKYALVYVDQLLNNLGVVQVAHNNLMSISLYHSQYNDIMMRNMSVPACSTYLLQQPISWGALFFPWHWRGFIKFVRKFGDKDPVVPDLYSNRWPTIHSWKKYLIRYMVEKDLYSLMTTHKFHKSLSTNHVESGSNDKNNSPFKPLLEVPLVSREDELCLPSSISDLPRIGSDLHSIASRDVSPASSFDACTLMMPVCSRIATVQDRVQYYTRSPVIGQVILILQPCNISSSLKLDIPDVVNDKPVIVKRMPENDLNNRYIPFDDILYDCIFSSDDDWDVDYDVMSFSFRTWRAHFFDHLVGHFRLARSHYKMPDGTFEYRDQSLNLTSGVSIVLPGGGGIFHKKYLKKYHSLKYAQAREYVSVNANCEDILLNFVISDHNRHGPVIIRSWVNMNDTLANAGGLWKRPTHAKQRSECLTYFIKLYGNDVLKYTTSSFDSKRIYGLYGVTPGLSHYTFRTELLHD